MNKRLVARRPVEWEEVAAEVCETEPDPDKGTGDWEAFTSAGSEEWLSFITENLSGEEHDVALPKRPNLYSAVFARLLVFAASPSLDPDVASVQEEFAELANCWHDETDQLSSPSRITGHDTYLRIVSMGKRVIPLILEDLRERGGHWYRALRILSGEDPVPAEARGDVKQMRQLWLAWGRDRGYII